MLSFEPPRGFTIPTIPDTFGAWALPVMLGAKEVAFPRTNLSSYLWCVTGASFLLYRLAAGGIDSGWTLQPPTTQAKG